MNARVPALALLILVALSVVALAEDSSSVALTVYNDGDAIVRETRTIDVPAGVGEVRFEDVAATIDPTTVKFRSLTDPEGTAVIEQNYEYDLVSADKLLEKYLGQKVEVVTQDGATFTGMLMSFDQRQLVIQESGSVLRIIGRPDNVKNVTCIGLPEGLIIKPTLMWLLQSAAGGSQSVEVAYGAGGCGWRADYTAVLNDDDTALDLSGWVTLTNNSGKTYNDASLKLMAGEVHRAPEAKMAGGRAGSMSLGLRMDESAAFQEKSFAEYHLYTLPRRTTIKDRQIKQIELLSAASVPVKKEYLFDPLRDLSPYWSGPMMDENFSVGDKGKTQVFIIFKNDKASNLGMPLPAGRMRLFKMDGGDMEFVGEDNIEHTPKDEKLEILMGNAFDIAGERTRTNFVSGRGARWMEESFEIKVRNHKDQPITVNAREHLFRWVNWKLTSWNHDYEKLDAQTIQFPIALAPDQEKIITYTVRYEW